MVQVLLIRFNHQIKVALKIDIGLSLCHGLDLLVKHRAKSLSTSRDCKYGTGPTLALIAIPYYPFESAQSSGTTIKMSMLLLERKKLFQSLNDHSYIPIDRPVMSSRVFSCRLRGLEVVGQ